MVRDLIDTSLYLLSPREMGGMELLKRERQRTTERHIHKKEKQKENTKEREIVGKKKERTKGEKDR